MCPWQRGGVTNIFSDPENMQLLEKGRANLPACSAFRAAHFPSKRLFRRVRITGGFFFIPRNEELILSKFRARNLSYKIPAKTDILSNFLTGHGATFSSDVQAKWPSGNGEPFVRSLP